MPRLLKIYISLTVLAVVFTACSHNRLKDADISKVSFSPVTILRLDQDIHATKPDSFRAVTKAMIEKYGNFYNSFIFNIVNLGGAQDSVFAALKRFVTDPDMNQVYNAVQKTYSNEEIKKLEEEFTKSFTYFKYHFPKQEMPQKFVSFISGWNYNVTTMDSCLGISLDMYMGKDHKYYQLLQWPRYKVRTMSREYLVSDAMRGWIIHCFDQNETQNNLINHMIFYGKIYYALDAVLPFEEDSIKIGYTTAQMEYCTQYKKNLWAHFSEKDRLFKNDLKELAPYVSEGPFTSAIGKQCPPRIGMYIGWQIVRSYMDKNPEITLEQLMNETDANKILNKSKYKP